MHSMDYAVTVYLSITR